uniref:Purple acid phosphatase Fn3-like domain-containing protein n=1 Tax=Chenopodium quinoa TaxID=63459 RepID=A0A803MYF6_CHEQI
MLNRKFLTNCSPISPYLRIGTDAVSPLAAEQIVTVTVSGVLHPSDKDWVAMISPSHSDVRNCPFNVIRYLETGDLSDLPLLCHYPVKMRVTWVSGNNSSQEVRYDNGKSKKSIVTTFTSDDMCGSLLVVDAITEEVSSGNIDSIFHIGDISYATGFLVEWDCFLHMISPFAFQVPYMTAIGNHERDYPGSGSMYITTDSGGECGIPYETYFRMPTSAKDKPWYSIEQGPVHFTVISTEHDWKPNSEEVDMGMCGHVHNYERTCAVYKGECKANPVKDENGIDTVDNTNYSAPIHVVMGMAGFSLREFSIFVSLFVYF